MSVINRNSGSPIYDTTALALLSDLSVGQLPITLGATSALDGGGATYIVRATGSGGIVMANNNELVVYSASTGAIDAAVAAAAASAAAALVSEDNAAADVVLTNADVVLTSADVVLTAADATATGLDVTSTNADLVATNQDTIDTAADLTLTNADVVTAAASSSAAAASASAALISKNAAATSETNAGLSETAAGLSETNAAADVVLTAADAVSTAADAASSTASASSASLSAALADTHANTPSESFSVGWVITSPFIFYDNKSFDFSSQETDPLAMALSIDGTKFYIVGGNDTVYQYTLSTAWDISTASYASKSLSVSAQETAANGLAFSSDGTKAFIVGFTNDTIYQYTISTAWDISTASYASKSFSVASQSTFPVSLSFKTDGTTCYIADGSSGFAYQYTLATAWDISTASYASKSFNLSSEGGAATRGINFSSNGLKMIKGFSGATDAVFAYTLSTAWDISTLAYASETFTGIGAQDSIARDTYFSPDGTILYYVGGGDNTYQYTTNFVRV